MSEKEEMVEQEERFLVDVISFIATIITIAMFLSPWYVFIQ
jgi:hypothetical protein